MKHNFQIVPINADEVKYLLNMDEQELSKIGARRMTVDKKPGFPCRISLEDAEIGEKVILFPYRHHDVTSPYQASGPVFIRETARTARLDINEIPVMLHHRMLSLRAYTANAMMTKGWTVEGKNLAHQVEEILKNPAVQYIQIHNSGPGCYNCQVNRVESGTTVYVALPA